MVLKPRFPVASTVLLAIGMFALAKVAGALAPRNNHGPLDSLTLVSESLQVGPQSEAFDHDRVTAGDSIVWDIFRGRHGNWNAVVDKRTGKIESAQGKGIPFVPGSGNQLQLTDLSADFGDDLEVDFATMEAVTRTFLREVASLLGVDPSMLTLNQSRSSHPADDLWFVDFDVTLDGMVVEGARVVFQVNNGNLIQFRSEDLPAKGIKTPEVKVTRNQALAALTAYIGGFSAADSFVDGGSQRLIPIALADNRFADGFEPGKGRGLARVWQFVLRRDGDRGTWRARIDATSGKILEFRDVNDYPSAQAAGGATSLNGAQTRPVPFVDLSPTSIHNYVSSTVGWNLNSQSVGVIDACGWINLPWLLFPITTDDLSDSNDVNGVCNTLLYAAALKGSNGCSNAGEIQDGALHGPDANDNDPILEDKGKSETHVDWSATATSSRSSAESAATTAIPVDRKGSESPTSSPNRCGTSAPATCSPSASPHPGRSWTSSGPPPAPPPPPPQHSPDSGAPRPGPPVGGWEDPPLSGG